MIYKIFRNNLLKIIFAILLITSSFSYLVYKYNNDYSYSRILQFNNSISKTKLLGKFYFFSFNIFETIVDEFNVFKIYDKFKFNKPKTINLILSTADQMDLEAQVEKAKKKGFIHDSIKKWRKAKLQSNNEDYSVEFKLHGTSISPLVNGKKNLRIKFDDDKKYLDGTRQSNLINIFSKSDENIPTIFFNNYANNFGLLAPSGQVAILMINGKSKSFIYNQERHEKEWFEKKKITNYSILKNNDDWNKKNEIAHNSDFDLNEKNIEISGNKARSNIALGSINNLFNAIKSEDPNKILKLIDIDYFAKFLALLALVNDPHSITGDNLKYIYDYSTGKFKILFRQETGQVFKIDSKLENFNDALFENNPSYKSSLSHNLFKIILTNNEFRFQRDFYLNELIKKKEDVINTAKEIYDESYKVLIHSDIKLRYQKYLKNKFFNTLNYNLYFIEKYLNYSKIYATVEVDKNKNTISIISDTFIPHQIKVINFGGDKIYLEKDKKYLLPSLTFEKEKISYSEKQILFPSDKIITKIQIQNVLTKKNVAQENIYLNNIKKFKLTDYNSFVNSLESNKLEYLLEDNKLVIKKGNYIISSNIILPENMKAIIEKGTNFYLKGNISMLFRGDFLAKGTKDEKISVSKYNKSEPFGTFAIAGGNKKNFVLLDNFIINGGSQQLIEGIFFLSQLSIHNANVKIINSEIIGGISDDGANIKNSNVEISSSIFKDNKSDQLDLDFCTGKIYKSSFLSKNSSFNFNGDGIDLSGSNIILSENLINNAKDKAISVGEKSKVIIENHSFNENHIAIAIKDESTAYVLKNKFFNNNLNVSMYVKKRIFNEPYVYLNKNEYTENEIINILEKKIFDNYSLEEGVIAFIENINEKKFYKKIKNEITSSES